MFLEIEIHDVDGEGKAKGNENADQLLIRIIKEQPT